MMRYDLRSSEYKLSLGPGRRKCLVSTVYLIVNGEHSRRIFNESILKRVCLSFEWDVPVLKTVGRPTHNVLMHKSIKS